MDAETRMPAAFLGHGSPMNALERNRFSEAWRAFGASVPLPRAILMVSAHWYVNTTAVTALALMTQCADTARIARGRGTDAPNARHASV